MLKNISLLLLTLSVLISCRVWADEVKEPRIVKMNDFLLVYEDVAEKIIKNVKCDKIYKEEDNNIKICDNDPLVKKIIILYRQAEEEALHSDKQRFWVFDDKKEVGINFDKNKKLINKLMLPEQIDMFS